MEEFQFLLLPLPLLCTHHTPPYSCAPLPLLTHALCLPHLLHASTVQHTQTASGKAAHKLEAETEDFHRELASAPHHRRGGLSACLPAHTHTVLSLYCFCRREGVYRAQEADHTSQDSQEAHTVAASAGGGSQQQAAACWVGSCTSAALPCDSMSDQPVCSHVQWLLASALVGAAALDTSACLCCHCCCTPACLLPLPTLHVCCLCQLPPQLINEKPQIIQDYESGKAIPNPQVLSKLSRVLGVTLRKNPTK